MLSTQAAARPVGRATSLRVHARSRNSISPWGVQQPAAAGGVGDKLLPLLRTPLDLLALPGRVALGAAQSIPEVLEKIPADVERLSMLAQDPRPLEEKQAEVLGELEDRLVGYLQKGTDTEAEVLSSVAAALPDPVKEALPEPIKEVLRPRAAEGSSASASSSSSSSSNGTVAKPLATWTITSDMDDVVVEVEDEDDNLPPMTPAAIAASQTAAEVMEVNAAVAALREQLSALQANTDASRTNMIKLNLREAEEILRGRLEQMVPAHKAVGDAAVQAAIREAELLLEEVQALRL